MSIVLQAIAFNSDSANISSDALNIRRNASQPVTVPEWQRGTTFTAADSLAAYSLEDAIGRPVTIRARFSRLLPQIAFAEVRAVQAPLPWLLTTDGPPGAWVQMLLQTRINVLGEVAPETVVFRPDGDSEFVNFTLRNTRLSSCGIGVHRVRWHWQYRLGPGMPWLDFAYTEHTIYTVLRVPWMQEPADIANTQLPWTDVLDFACRWARGARTPVEAAAAITRTVFSLGNSVLSYDCTLGATAYAFEVFLLSELIELLRGGIGRGHYVNCSDCAAIVATFANAVGADLWQSRMGGALASSLGYFPVKPVRVIGSFTWGQPCGWWPGWTFHEVAWSDECVADDPVFDGSLQLDLYPPYRIPTMPTDLSFSFARQWEWLYRPLLVPPYGWPLCEPMPSTRRRRPVI